MDDFYDLPRRDEAMKDGKPVGGWAFVQTDDDTRVYYMPHKDTQPRGGFDFCCIEWVGDDGGDGRLPNPATIASPTCRVRTLFDGAAYFDGIRHLYFVGDGDGYVFCANIEQIMNALGALRKLELELCWAALGAEQGNAPKAP